MYKAGIYGVYIDRIYGNDDYGVFPVVISDSKGYGDLFSDLNEQI